MCLYVFVVYFIHLYFCLTIEGEKLILMFVFHAKERILTKLWGHYSCVNMCEFWDKKFSINISGAENKQHA